MLYAEAFDGGCDEGLAADRAIVVAGFAEDSDAVLGG
jgi:hypothetical protein